MKSIANMPGQSTAARFRAVVVSALLCSWLSVIAFSLLPPAQAAESAKVPCTTGERRPGSEKQQLCLAGHISGFGGYIELGCTMIIYLTDLKQETAARRILEPLSELMLSRCGNQVLLEFRKGQYTYTELNQWAERAAQLFISNEETRLERVSVSTTRFDENRIDLTVENDEAVRHAERVLRENGIPVEAFKITNREAERQAWRKTLDEVSLAPELRPGGDGERVIVPAVDWAGRRVAELTMGETSLDDVLKTLPPFPGHGPSTPQGARAPWLSKEVQEVLDRMRQSYNPASTWTIVGFDRRKKLIFVQNSIMEEQAERFAAELDALLELREVHRNTSYIARQGRLGSCVIVEILSMTKENMAPVVASAAFFYICRTRP